MDSDDLFYLAFAIAEFVIYFSVGAILTYITIGSWLKVIFFNIKCNSLSHTRKRLPIIVSSVLFSFGLVNPWVILFLIGFSVNRSSSIFYTAFICYFWLLSSTIDYAIMKFLPKLSFLKWLEVRLNLKRVLLVNLVVAVIAFVIGICCWKCGPIVVEQIKSLVCPWI
jgi:hypothetical protein